MKALLGLKSVLQGDFSLLDSSAAALMSLNSNSTSYTPLSLLNTLRPLSSIPLSTKLFGVSGKKIPPNKMATAGVPYIAREILHP